MAKRALKKFDGVFEIYKKLATKNLAPGQKVYGEELVRIEGTEYRIWNPNRSKIGAAIKNGLKKFPIKSGSNVLYLGCAEGTTVSHISDITGEKGAVFGLDISAKVMHKFLYLCSVRKNLVPLLFDASRPQDYKQELEGFRVDVLFQDVSQKNQVEMFLANAKMHLKKGGHGMLTLKARSISSTADPKQIFKEELAKLQKEMKVTQVVALSPYEKDHILIHCEKK